MAKLKTQYRCSECGHIQAKWSGKCGACHEWNTLNEEEVSPEVNTKNRTALRNGYSNISNKLTKLSEIKPNQLETTKCGIVGIDNLLSSNKGLVRGSITLIGGNPGIGKSTLLLQLSSLFSKVDNAKVIYFSGEESDSQITLRAKRLGITDDILIANISDLESILRIMDDEKPTFVVIDSAQTLYTAELAAMSGSVSQVRECVAAIAQKAKQMNIDTFIIGHVTKDGEIAGPQTLSHIVDTVLYFDGSDDSNYRILTAEKNRYGSTDENVILEMTEHGLVEIEDPSAIFLENNYHDLSVGTTILSTIYNNKGSQNNNSALLVEVQSLITESGGQYSTKVANGIDYKRFAILIGVVKNLTNVPLHKMDIFINIVSGLKIDDSGVDLAVCLAILSSLKSTPMRKDTAVFGEVSLNGNLRLPRNIEKRIAAAEKVGFKNIIIPMIQDKSVVAKVKKNHPNINIIMCKNMIEADKNAFLD